MSESDGTTAQSVILLLPQPSRIDDVIERLQVVLSKAAGTALPGKRYFDSGSVFPFIQMHFRSESSTSGRK